jgi:hypothetical protein
VQTLLWPYAKDSRAQHSLDQTLYTLRRKCPTVFIDVDTTYLRLRNGISADFLELRAALHRDDVLSAVGLLRGEFLISAKDVAGEDLEDWRTARHAYFMHALKAKLGSAIETAKSSRKASVAAQLAEEGARVFPDEVFYAEVMVESCLQLGRLDKARVIWDDYQARADAGLVTSPTISWLELVSKTERPQLQRSAPFVGRAKELATLQTAWMKCESGKGDLVIVHGSAGIGKTSLCDQFTSTLGRAQVVHSPAHKGEEHLGFNVLATIMQAAFGPSKAAERLAPPLLAALIDTFPELPHSERISVTPLVYEAAQRRVYEAAASVIHFLAEEHPVVLYLDDIQWADEATLAWTAYASRRLTESRVLILCTMRPGPESKTIAVSRLSLLNRSANVIKLNELSEADVVELVHIIRPTARSTDLADDLFRRTGGHPLLLSAALQNGLEVGGLASTREARYLASELAGLPRPARRCVEFLAAIAAPTSVAVLAELVGVTVKSMLALTERASFLCQTNSDNEIDFKHDLMREAVYASLTSRQLCNLHRRVAEYYENSQQAPGLITRHYWEAGMKADAARFVVQAAATSEIKHAFAEAEYFYKLALEALTEPTAHRRILERYADMLFRGGEYARAAPEYLKLIEHYDLGEHDLVRWQARYLEACWSAALLPTSEIRVQVIELRHSALALQHDEAYLVASRILLAMPMSSDEDYDTKDLRDELLRFGERAPVTRVGVVALCHAGRLFTLEDASSAVHYLRIAAQWAEQLRELDLLVLTARSLALALYEVGQFRECHDILRRVVRTIEQHGATYYLPEVAEPLASLLVELDDPKEARHWLAISTTGPVPFRYLFAGVGNRAQLEYHLNNFEACVAECERFPQAYTNVVWQEIAIRGLRGLSLIELGRLDEARKDATRTETLLKSFEGRFCEVSFGLLLIARIARFDSDQTRVRPIIENCVAAFEKRDFVCRQRMRLALAEVLSTEEAARAIEICTDVIRIADDNGLVPLGMIARAIQRRVKRKSAASTRR